MQIETTQQNKIRQDGEQIIRISKPLMKGEHFSGKEYKGKQEEPKTDQDVEAGRSASVHKIQTKITDGFSRLKKIEMTACFPLIKSTIKKRLPLQTAFYYVRFSL